MVVSFTFAESTITVVYDGANGKGTYSGLEGFYEITSIKVISFVLDLSTTTTTVLVPSGV